MKSNASSYTLGKSIIRVVFIVVAILLIINFARKLTSGADLSFSAFLNWLGNIDYYSISVKISSFTIKGDWGIVDGLRKFFNMFGNLFGVSVYMCANLINLILFLMQFVRFIFV